jgi:hypothetical protein
VLRTGGRVLVSFHVGSEDRHLDQWWGQAVDIDFRFLEVADVAEVMERAIADSVADGGGEHLLRLAHRSSVRRGHA